MSCSRKTKDPVRVRQIFFYRIPTIRHGFPRKKKKDQDERVLGPSLSFVSAINVTRLEVARKGRQLSAAQIGYKLNV